MRLLSIVFLLGLALLVHSSPAYAVSTCSQAKAVCQKLCQGRPTCICAEEFKNCMRTGNWNGKVNSWSDLKKK